MGEALVGEKNTRYEGILSAYSAEGKDGGFKHPVDNFSDGEINLCVTQTI